MIITIDFTFLRSVIYIAVAAELKRGPLIRYHRYFATVNLILVDEQ